ncbi:MAG: tetratricopeptide repeat protein, partial [Candidatus Promineifilaceae bacterium]|nr:tetratricopeptide repeat protein [Candidatus Promineifilaceae bacterium]
IVANTLQRGEARYSLLESIRQYAQERMVASGEGPEIRDRHLQCFVALAEETEPELKGDYQQLWLNWLEEEYDNIRAAFSWSLKSGQIESGLRMAIAIHQFWTVRDYMEEGAAWLERLLSQINEKVPAEVYAHALAHAAFLAEFQGNGKAQRAYGEEAAALAERLGDGEKEALAWALQAQAFGARATGDEETGFALYKRLAALYRESGDRYRLGSVLTTCGIAAMSLSKYDEARAMLQEAMPLVRDEGDPYGIAMLLNFSGDLSRCEQRYTEAKNAYEESISLLRGLDAARQLASALHNLAHTCLHLGNLERARTLFEESLALHQAQQNVPGIAECLIGLAALAISGGLPAAGARLLAAAVALGGERVVTAWEATRLEYEGALEAARAGLTEEDFRAEQAAGRTLPLEEAATYAKGVAEEVAQQAAAAERAREKLEELTPREREVTALIAQTKSNGEIAEELVVSKRTVEKHIANIRSKLALTKRTQIVRWAIRSGLVNAN